MASELSFAISLSANKGGISANKSFTGTADVDAVSMDYLSGTVTVTGSPVQLELPAAGNIGYLAAKNQSATYSIHVGVDAVSGGSAPDTVYATLLPGQVILMPVNGNEPPYFYTAAEEDSVLEYIIIEA